MTQPENFGRYTVTGVLGRGAMGDVYLAEDPVIGREVAIKVVQAHPDLSPEEEEALRARFEQEFRLAGTLSHPSIVTIHDVGSEGGASFIAMERIRGETLKDIMISERVLSFKEISDIWAQVADALDFAHERGIVHRDIKPANIMITRDGRPKLADFGVAKVNTSNLTTTGSIIGTPAYMSPEQITGHPVTGASDQFSFAVILYEMLTGQQPFAADHPTTTMYKIVHEDPPNPVELKPDLPVAVSEVLKRALDKNPQRRFNNCKHFALAAGEALGAAVPDATVGVASTDWSTPPPTLTQRQQQRSKIPLIAGSLVGIGILAVAAWFIASGRPAPLETTEGGGEAAVSSDAESGTEPGATSETDSVATAPADPAAASAEPAEPPPPEPVTITVRTDPAGATVTLDGETVQGTTPLDIQVLPDTDYQVSVALDGYEGGSLGFSLDSLSATQLEQSALDFPLTLTTPPGYLVVEAPYRVRVSVDGRRYGPAQNHRIELRDARYNVTIEAPDVFYSSTESVTIRSEQENTIALPEAVSIGVFAIPANCRITIDGREAGFSPLNDLQITVGQHEFVYEWPAPIDRTLTVTETIRRSGQRLSQTAPDQ